MKDVSGILSLSVRKIIPLTFGIFSSKFSRIWTKLVSETINYKIYYKNIRKIFEDLKGIGENKILSNRKKSLMTNNYLNTLDSEYSKRFSDKNGLRLSCDVVSVSSWKNKTI